MTAVADGGGIEKAARNLQIDVNEVRETVAWTHDHSDRLDERQRQWTDATAADRQGTKAHPSDEESGLAAIAAMPNLGREPLPERDGGADRREH